MPEAAGCLITQGNMAGFQGQNNISFKLGFGVLRITKGAGKEDAALSNLSNAEAIRGQLQGAKPPRQTILDNNHVT